MTGATLGSAIATALAGRDREPPLERDVFGTTDPERIATLVDRFCGQRLGARIAGYEFFATSAGSVHGVRLRDRRRVVVKAYRRDIDLGHLAAVQRVQARLADGGFPAPRPLLAPAQLAHGIAVVEALLDRGDWADAHDPTVRRAVAAGLARLVERTRLLVGLPGLVPWRESYDRLWRQPHDRRFDFPGTARGAEWIDRLATEATRRLDEGLAGDPVVGHGDWRVEHLRFAGGALSAVYDWDSLAVGPEPVFAGAAAHAFTADWSIEGHRCIPTIEESLAFLADYQAARGAAFTDGEHRAALSGLVAAMAYSARCEHSDRLTALGTRPPAPPATPIPAGGCLGILSRHGLRLLSRYDDRAANGTGAAR
jgi:hypothetical protein